MGAPNFNFPNFNLPNFELPRFELPNFNAPNFNAPNFNVLDIQLPSVQFPNIQLPNVQFPNIQLSNIPNFPDVQLPRDDVLKNSVGAAKEAVNIAKVLPVMFSIALIGSADGTGICEHFEEGPLDLSVDLEPIVHFMQIEAGEHARDFREDHEKLYYGDTRADILKKLANFKPDWPTKILVHGFQNKWPNKRLAWQDHIMYELPIATVTNKNKGYNLFVFSYDHEHITKREDSNLVRSYARLAYTIPALGAFLGQFLYRLAETIPGVNFAHFHLIGHSLGAHLAGMAGKSLKKHSNGKYKLGYITGLDPAGPCFEDNDADGRLDVGDAIRVDAIHSNKGGFGIARPVGHIDVQLNNGINQPGARNAIMSHAISMLRLFSTHDYNCQYLAYKCDNYEQYMQGDCPACDNQQNQQNCIQYKQWPHYDQPNERNLTNPGNPWMREPTNYRSYFTSTSDSEPYCQNIAQIDIKSNWRLPDVGTITLENNAREWSELITIKRSIRQPIVCDRYTGKTYYHYTGLLEVRGPFYPVTSATYTANPIYNSSEDQSSNAKLDIKMQVQYRSDQSLQNRLALSTKLCVYEYDREHVTLGAKCSE